MKDEQHTLEPLHGQLCEVLESLGESFELIFVDDGSSDDSFEIMKTLHEKDDRVRVLRFWRNSGKSPALAAGFDRARGRIIFTMDGDLQDDPHELPHLLEKLNEGYDVVSGWKKERHDPWIKKQLSFMFNGVVSFFTGIPLNDFNCGLKAYRREVLQPVCLYGEMHRFIPVLASHYGYRVGEVVVTHHPRLQGRSKYGMERLYRGLLDFTTVMFIMRYGQRPSHLFGLLGCFGLGLGTISGLLSLVPLIAGWFLVAIVLLGFTGLCFGLGLQLICLGLFAELVVWSRHRTVVSYFVNESLDAHSP